MGIDFTGRGRLRGRALSDGRFTSMLRTVYHHLGDSWKWAHEASDFAASLFYSSISGVSKWFFPQAPSKLSTQTFKPVHNLGYRLCSHGGFSGSCNSASKLAVQRRYNMTVFLCVLSGSLQGIAVRPLPCHYNRFQFFSALSRRYHGFKSRR